MKLENLQYITESVSTSKYQFTLFWISGTAEMVATSLRAFLIVLALISTHPECNNLEPHLSR